MTQIEENLRNEIVGLEKELAMQKQLNEHLVEKNKALEKISEDQWNIINEMRKERRVYGSTGSFQL